MQDEDQSDSDYDDDGPQVDTEKYIGVQLKACILIIIISYVRSKNEIG